MKINDLLIVLVVSAISFHGLTAFGQSWNPTTGEFDGTGDFSATENSDPWTGPGLSTTNGGQLTFVGDAEHNGRTSVDSGTSVVVAGAFNHTNVFQAFSVVGNDLQGNSSLTISDVANSSITASNIEVRAGSVNVNFATAADGLTIVGTGATLNTIAVSYTHLTLPTIYSV